MFSLSNITSALGWTIVIMFIYDAIVSYDNGSTKTKKQLLKIEKESEMRTNIELVMCFIYLVLWTAEILQ